MLSSASDKAKVFTKSFPRNCSLDDSSIFLAALPSRNNLKLHNISVTPKMVKKVITKLVVLLKNCELELSYVLAELFSMCLKEFCFPHYWKVSAVVPVFRNVGERSTTLPLR